jgi:hypothetical protein
MDGRKFEISHELGPHCFQMVVPFGLLAEALDDPDPNARRKRGAEPSARLREFHLWREEIQRPFRGTKKANVPRYRRYILDHLEGRNPYAYLPELLLWAGPQPLVTRLNHVTLPLEQAIIALDGETQLAGRFDLLAEGKGALAPVVTRIYHGVPMVEAKQLFYVANALGVNLQAAQALMRDQHNPITSTARRLSEIFDDTILTTTGSGGFLTVLSVRQALCWTLWPGKLKENRRTPASLEADLKVAADYLAERLHALRPGLATDPQLRRNATFIACCDRRVTLADIDGRVPDDPFWRSGVGLTAAGIETTVSHLRQMPFPQGLPNVETGDSGAAVSH